MKRQIRETSWRRWLKIHRLLPLLTILAAAVVSVLGLVGIIKLQLEGSLILGLLTLLSIDGLTERISILERLDNKLSQITNGTTLKTRREILYPVDHAENASEICIVAIHATSVIASNIGFLDSKLKSGCKIRIVLLNPDASDAVKMWDYMTKKNVTKSQIQTTLSILESSLTQSLAQVDCEVRLLDFVVPFSIFAVDMDKKSGSMIVEYQSCNVAIDERPHVHLTIRDSPYWFKYYKKQFKDLFDSAVPW